MRKKFEKAPPKVNIQMANSHVKIYSTAWVIGNQSMQNKTTMKYSAEWLNLKRLTIPILANM